MSYEYENYFLNGVALHKVAAISDSTAALLTFFATN